MENWWPIDFELFHFLRPGWLWLFVPMALAVAVMLPRSRRQRKWEKYIAPGLRSAMILKGSRFASAGPWVVFVLACSLMIVAAAGPTWHKIEIPGAKREAVLLIGLDLSASMLAQDVSPNRLERAKFKVIDLLDADPAARVGLFAFAGSAHPVITPSRDYELVKYQLKALAPGIMPLQGTNFAAALHLADTILRRTKAPCTLMLLTDNVDQAEAAQLTDFVNATGNSLEIMTFATPQGAKIPAYRKGQFFTENGKPVISKLNQQVLFQLQKEPGIHIYTLSLGSEDVEKIAERIRKNLVFQEDNKENDASWQEMGFPLLWACLVFFVLWFRKGWMIQWCLVAVTLFSCSGRVETWDDLWFTRDFQGQRLMDEGHYDEAAEQFTSLPHRGVAYLQAGDYPSAIEIFKQDTSALSMYNLALAYAANGEHEHAAEALQLAGDLAPENTAIREAIDKNNEALRKIDSLQNHAPQTGMELKQEKEKGELNERRGTTEDEELSSDNEVKELPKDGDRITDEVESGMRKAEEMEKPPEDFQAGKGGISQNVMLREISADPAEFLRRRFKFQFDKYHQKLPKPEHPW